MMNDIRMILLPLVVCFVYTEAQLFRLNDTEYRKMPPLFAMDDYHDCLLEPGGTYCIVDMELFTDQESDLMKIIHGYSAVSTKHFNHTQLHRSVCITQTCKPYIGQRDTHNEEDITAILEACINNTIFTQYNIQARVGSLKECQREGDVVEYDVSDYAMVGVLFVLIVLNSLGTFYHIYKKEDSKGNPYLMSFSLLRNWKKMVAPSGEGPEPRLARLKLFNGLRAMTVICVIFSHVTFLTAYSYVQNTVYIERAGDDPSKQMLYNGSLVVSTFFVMAGFLLAFNFELYAEKHRVGWLELPKGLIMRWLRLTPVYAIIIGLVSTVMRRLGTGPLWNQVVTTESNACRQYWWAHLFYINNYVYSDNECLPQTWYLAADTQLFILGLALCIGCRTPRAQKIALSLMMLVALLTPALTTYFEDLEAIVIQAPETVRNVYKTDNVFRHVYIPAHTNLASYTFGMGGGLLTFHWLTQGLSDEHFKKYRYLFWLLFPLGVLVILSGAMFYGDARAPLALRVVYAALYKPTFQLLLVILIINIIFKTDKVYRGIIEWRGFTCAGRLAYSAFFVHTLVLRAYVGALTTPIYLNDYIVFVILCATIFVSFMVAAILWLVAEAPAKELISAVMRRREPEAENTKC